MFPHAGNIENTLNQVDTKTGTLEMQAQFPNPQGSMLPGQFGRVRYVSEHRTGAILVPQRAVQQNQRFRLFTRLGRTTRCKPDAVKTGPACRR